VIGDLFADFDPIAIETTLPEHLVRLAAEAAAESLAIVECAGTRVWCMTVAFAWRGVLRTGRFDATWREGALTIDLACPAYGLPPEDEHDAVLECLAEVAPELAERIRERVRVLERAISSS